MKYNLRWNLELLSLLWGEAALCRACSSDEKSQPRLCKLSTSKPWLTHRIDGCCSWQFAKKVMPHSPLVHCFYILKTICPEQMEKEMTSACNSKTCNKKTWDICVYIQSIWVWQFIIWMPALYCISFYYIYCNAWNALTVSFILMAFVISVNQDTVSS